MLVLYFVDGVGGYVGFFLIFLFEALFERIRDHRSIVVML